MLLSAFSLFKEVYHIASDCLKKIISLCSPQKKMDIKSVNMKKKKEENDPKNGNDRVP